MKYIYVILSFIFLIIVSLIIYWDFFSYHYLNDPILSWTWTWILSPEIELEVQWKNLHITWFVMRGSAEEFSHFRYTTIWNDIYLSAYVRPIPFLFHYYHSSLDLKLKEGAYHIYYKNSNNSTILIKSVTIK